MHNRPNQKISIHHLYSKNHLPINNAYKQSTSSTIPSPTYIYPAVISPSKQNYQYQQNTNPITSTHLGKKIINSSHYVIGEPVGYAHSNVLPPKYKPFQPSANDIYMNLNASSSKQALQSTKSSPNFEIELPSKFVNRSLQTLHSILPFNKNTDIEKEKDQRIMNFFNSGHEISNDEEQIRNILAECKQVIEKENNTDIETVEKYHAENVLQASQSLQEMKEILEYLIKIKRQEIKQKQKKYQRNKNIASRIQNLLNIKISPLQ